jgi:hypothetical protein
MRTTAKQQCWSQHVESWQSSSLGRSAYCQEHNLKPNQFHYWKQKFTVLNKTSRPQPSSSLSAFVPLSINSAPLTTSGLTLRLPNGYELTGIEAEHLPTLARLLEVLL